MLNAQIGRVAENHTFKKDPYHFQFCAAFMFSFIGQNILPTSYTSINFITEADCFYAYYKYFRKLSSSFYGSTQKAYKSLL